MWIREKSKQQLKKWIDVNKEKPTKNPLKTNKLLD